MPEAAVTPVRHVVYLHGFASSPSSGKAQRFARELAALGVGFACPDLNEPSFETLTVTRMLTQARRAIADAPAGPVALVGSSLGGFVALHAATEGTVDRLILLAPALDFGGNRLRQLGDQGIDEWRRTGWLTVFHHAADEPRQVGFALYEDAAAYDAFSLTPSVPVLVFQGRQDDTVDPATVLRWARDRPNVDLRMVEDGHQLAASMDVIWKESRRFLGLD
jgi:pimeloyl-ACP methyl ester carboxylesterase